MGDSSPIGPRTIFEAFIRQELLVSAVQFGCITNVVQNISSAGSVFVGPKTCCNPACGPRIERQTSAKKNAPGRMGRRSAETSFCAGYSRKPGSETYWHA